MHIIGASGHGKVVAEIIFACNLQIEGVWDENLKIKFLLNTPLSGNLESFKRKQLTNFIIAIGNNSVRKHVSNSLNFTTSKIIHPKSAVSQSVLVAEGTVIMCNASVNACSRIGKHVIVNTNSSIDHDCIIGDYVHISPQAGLAGNVEVGEGTHIGIGASVIQGVKIGKWVTIGAGAVIIRDVPDYAVVVGNPGKIIKYNNNE